MARTTLSFYAVCFILALTGSALPARRADASSSASAVAPSGTANFVYDAVKVRYTLNTPEGPVIDRTQSVTHMAQDMNKEFSDDDETPKPTPIDTHPVPPKPSSSETATKSLKDDYEEQTAQKVHDLEEPSSSPKPKANAQTEPPTEERPTEERKESEPAPTPTPTKQQPASSSSAAPAASSSVHKDDAITKLPVVGPILGKVL